MTHDSQAPDDLIPPAPWAWEPTLAGGLRLAAADGTDVLVVDAGRGTPELRSEAVKALLAEAASMATLLEEARGWARGYQKGWFDVDTDNPPAWLTAPLNLRSALDEADED